MKLLATTQMWFFSKFRFSDQRKTPQCKAGPCPNKKKARKKPLILKSGKYFLALSLALTQSTVAGRLLTQFLCGFLISYVFCNKRSAFCIAVHCNVPAVSPPLFCIWDIWSGGFWNSHLSDRTICCWSNSGNVLVLLFCRVFFLRCPPLLTLLFFRIYVRFLYFPLYKLVFVFTIVNFPSDSFPISHVHAILNLSLSACFSHGADLFFQERIYLWSVSKISICSVRGRFSTLCCITATFCPGSHGSRIQPSTHFWLLEVK